MNDETLALIRKAAHFCSTLNEARKSGEIVMLEDTAGRLEELDKELNRAFASEQFRRELSRLSTGEVSAEECSESVDDFLTDGQS